MTPLREAAQQALEALDHFDDVDKTTTAITALKAALAEPVQEPRPIQECYGDCPTEPATCTNPCNFEGRVKPPPQRKPLTEEELDNCWCESGGLSLKFARAIERAHGIGGEA